MGWKPLACQNFSLLGFPSLEPTPTPNKLGFVSPQFFWTGFFRILYIVEVELLDLNGFLITGCCEIMWDARGALAFFSQVNVASGSLFKQNMLFSWSLWCTGSARTLLDPLYVTVEWIGLHFVLFIPHCLAEFIFLNLLYARTSIWGVLFLHILVFAPILKQLCLFYIYKYKKKIKILLLGW